jgi:hypothetical protein
MDGAKTISLFSQPYLDTYNQCYKNIVVANVMPKGPLAHFVKRVKFPRLSTFKESTCCNPIKDCGLALTSLNVASCNNCYDKNNGNLMIVDEVPDLMTFLLSNGYSVDTSLTKMFNTSEIRFGKNIGVKLICFVTYNG